MCGAADMPTGTFALGRGPVRRPPVAGVHKLSWKDLRNVVLNGLLFGV